MIFVQIKSSWRNALSAIAAELEAGFTLVNLGASPVGRPSRRARAFVRGANQTPEFGSQLIDWSNIRTILVDHRWHTINLGGLLQNDLTGVANFVRTMYSHVKLILPLPILEEDLNVIPGVHMHFTRHIHNPIEM